MTLAPKHPVPMTTSEARTTDTRILFNLRRTAWEVGSDLLDMREREGYKAFGYTSFADYVTDRLAMTKGWASQHETYARAIRRALPIGANAKSLVERMPTLTQFRDLHRYYPEQEQALLTSLLNGKLKQLPSAPQPHTEPETNTTAQTTDSEAAEQAGDTEQSEAQQQTEDEQAEDDAGVYAVNDPDAGQESGQPATGQDTGNHEADADTQTAGEEAEGERPQIEGMLEDMTRARNLLVEQCALWTSILQRQVEVTDEHRQTAQKQLHEVSMLLLHLSHDAGSFDPAKHLPPEVEATPLPDAIAPGMTAPAKLTNKDRATLWQQHKETTEHTDVLLDGQNYLHESIQVPCWLSNASPDKGILYLRQPGVSGKTARSPKLVTCTCGFNTRDAQA